MEKIQPSLIKIARKLRGMSMDKTIEEMGVYAVTKMAISKFERGLAAPSSQTLHALASAYNVPVSFFYAEPLDIAPIGFRYKDDKVPTDKDKQIERRIRLKIEESYHMHLLGNAPSLFDVSFMKPLVRTYSDAETAAEQIRNKWQLGKQPIHSVYETLQENGIMVLEMNIESEDLIGTSTIINNSIPVIIINLKNNATTERKRFTALHELGHVILNIKPAKQDTAAPERKEIHKPPTVERLCHRFAAAMLLPYSCITRRFGEERSDISLKELISIRNMYGVSISATLHRAYDLDIIPGEPYHSFFENQIVPNIMEKGWGEYPIMEHADYYELLEEIVKIERLKNG